MSVTIKGSGQVPVQVITTTLTTVQNFSFSSNTYGNVTGFSVSITPTNSANKILVMYSTYCSNSVNAANYGNFLQVTRNGTAVGVGTSASMFAAGSGGYSVTNRYGSNYSQVFIDSPATTSTLTYQVQAAFESGGGSVGGSYGTGTAYVTVPSTITVMEIAYA